MSRWDELTLRRRVMALAAADAHASMGLTGGSNPYGDRSPLALPGYEHIFRSFFDRAARASSYGRANVGRTSRRARNSQRAPLFVDRCAWHRPRGCRSARRVVDTPQRPATICPCGPVAIRVNTTAPAGARIDLLRNGVRVSSSVGGAPRYTAPAEPGVFRVEVLSVAEGQESGVPWLLSNPIYVGRPEVPGEAEHKPVETVDTVCRRATRPRLGHREKRSVPGRARRLLPPSAEADCPFATPLPALRRRAERMSHS